MEDPDYFYLFVSDGTIAVREGLSLQDAHRARETLRILNLNAQYGPLRRMRQQAVAGYLETAEELREMAEVLEPDEWLPELQKELALIESLPFATAIRHVLEP